MKVVIYLVENGVLLEIEEEYGSEGSLQKDLAEYPSLLADERINQDDLHKWLLVKHESSISDEEEVAGRWSVEHIFLDQLKKSQSRAVEALCPPDILNEYLL